MICPKCKADIPDAADFCPNCGTKAPNRPCAQCGASLPMEASFCPFCGKQVSQAEAYSQAPWGRAKQKKRFVLPLVFLGIAILAAAGIFLLPRFLEDVKKPEQQEQALQERTPAPDITAPPPAAPPLSAPPTPPALTPPSAPPAPPEPAAPPTAPYAASVSLFSLSANKENGWRPNTLGPTDAKGNTHYYSSSYLAAGNGNYAEYALNGGYSQLSGKIVAHELMHEDGIAIFVVFADGVAVYISPDVNTDTDVFEFKADISGAHKIRTEVIGVSETTNRWLLILDLTLE